MMCHSCLESKVSPMSWVHAGHNPFGIADASKVQTPRSHPALPAWRLFGHLRKYFKTVVRSRRSFSLRKAVRSIDFGPVTTTRAKPDPVFLLQNAVWPAFLVDGGGTIRKANLAAIEVFGSGLESDST